MSNFNDDRQEQLKRAKSKAEDYQNQPLQDAEKLSDQPRTMKQWRSLIEERIQAAMEKGDFDNLPGQGKPLNLHKNPYVDSSTELTHKLLRNNGYTAEWIERDIIIRRELEVARERLHAAWQYYQPNPEAKPGWQAAVSRFEEALIKINRKIDDYNLVVPILSKHRLHLRLEDELRRIR